VPSGAELDAQRGAVRGKSLPVVAAILLQSSPEHRTIALDEFPNDPAIKDRVTLETHVGRHTVVNLATIANLTANEIWVAVALGAAMQLDPGADVRVVLSGPSDTGFAADTVVERIVGGAGRLIALRRPQAWTSQSKRANSRAYLAIPAYLRPDGDGTVASARTTNVSVGGFHCLTELPLRVGDQVSVSLMFSPTEAFECEAQVVRLTEDLDDPSRRRLVAAFRFIDLAPDDEARVAEALVALATETDQTAVPVAWRRDDARSRVAG